MKTVLIVGSYGDSLVNFRGQLIQDLVAHGYRVLASAPDLSVETRSVLESWGVNVQPIPLKRNGIDPLSDLAYLRAMRRLIKTAGIDLTISYTIKPVIWGGFAAWGTKARSIGMITGLGYYFTHAGDTPSLKQKLVAALIRRLYRSANRKHERIIMLNSDDLHDMTQAGCLPNPKKVRLVAGSGVDLTKFAPVSLSKDVHFLMISRLLKNKGVREFGEAAIKLKKMIPHAVFELVGNFDAGPDEISRTDLERWIEGGLVYSGPLKDVRPAITRSSIYVLPSYREGLPRSVLEAMAMGRPIITTDTPGCRDTVQDGDNGFVVPVRNVTALCDAMERLAKDGTMRERMGQRSLEIARDKFDVRRVNADILKIIREVV